MEKNDNLLILPASETSINPTTLLNSTRMRDVVNTAMEKSEIFLIDYANLRAIKNVRTLSSIVDGIALVVNEGKTRRPVIKALITHLEQSKDYRMLTDLILKIGIKLGRSPPQFNAAQLDVTFTADSFHLLDMVIVSVAVLFAPSVTVTVITLLFPCDRLMPEIDQLVVPLAVPLPPLLLLHVTLPTPLVVADALPSRLTILLVVEYVALDG